MISLFNNAILVFPESIYSLITFISTFDARWIYSPKDRVTILVISVAFSQE